MELQAIFIDRDGTIGGTGRFIHPRDFEPYDNFYTSFELLRNKDIKIFAFTNQHRISKGEASIKDFQDEFTSYGFTDAYICPHELNSDCECQKPKPGMLFRAAEDYNLNLKNCVVIGDVGTDMVAANTVGAIKILVKTGWGKGSIGEYRDMWKDVEPDFIAEDILDAVTWIINNYYQG